MNTFWRFPVSVTSIVKGPFLKVLQQRRYEIAFSIEATDGEENMQALLFEGVEAFKCTHLRALGSVNQDLRNMSYGAVISVGDNPWFQEVKKSYVNSCAYERLPVIELRHLMITFDDGPCYEFICGAFKAV